MFNKKNIPETAKKIHKYVKTIKKAVKKIAKATNFIERKSNKFHKKEFEFIIFTAFETAQRKSLREATAELNKYYKIEMKRQGLEYKLKEKKTMIFVKEVYKYLLKRNLKGLEEIIQNETIRKFNNIYTEDSTLIEVNEKHKEKYKGANKKAIIKANLMYAPNKGGIKNINIANGRTSDFKISEDNLDLLEENDLIIRDLGYFKLSSFKKIMEKKAYFISRHKNGTTMKLGNGEKINNLYEYIKSQDKKMLDFNVFLGKEEVSVRVIAYEMPDEVYKKRLEKASKHSIKKNNKDITEGHKNELKYSIFITNIPQSVLAPELIGTLYKYRWEIELLFKELKSIFNLDKNYNIKNENRLITNIYLKFIAFMLLIPIKNIILSSVFSDKEEVSSFVLSHWLLNYSGIISMFSKNCFYDLFYFFSSSLSDFLMNNPYRYSLKNTISLSLSFFDTFLKPPKQKKSG